MPPKKKATARKAAASEQIEATAAKPASKTQSGRPQRSTAQEVDYSAPGSRKESNAGVKESVKSTKGGRQSKNTPAAEEPTISKPTKKAAASPAKFSKRKRDEVEEDEEVDEEEEEVVEPPKKRGKPSKTVNNDIDEPATVKRQRMSAPSAPAEFKTTNKKKPAAQSTAKASTKPTKPVQPEPEPEPEPEPDLKPESSDEEPLEEEDSDSQYWLMKAEPDSRIEKGIDVAYPIDKLAAATEPEPWDGVRSPVARNNMRAMRKGDLAFFYHSNCKEPGIVGVMRVVEEHSIDESAFDPTHPYYDEKSDRSKPKWDCVKVEFVKKFSDIISLKTLKSTPRLANMQIAQKAYGRLSVQKVTFAQWKFVLKMANEPEDLGVASNVSGYEADTNGEGELDKSEAEGDLVEETAVRTEHDDQDDEKADKVKEEIDDIKDEESKIDEKQEQAISDDDK